MWTGDAWVMLMPLRRHDKAIPGNQKKKLRKKPSTNQGSKAEYQREHLYTRRQSHFPLPDSHTSLLPLSDWELSGKGEQSQTPLSQSRVPKEEPIENMRTGIVAQRWGAHLECAKLCVLSPASERWDMESVCLFLSSLPPSVCPSISLFLPSSSAPRMIELYCIALLCTTAKSHESRRGWREECDAATSKPGCAVSWVYPLPSPRTSVDDVTTPGAHACSCTPTRSVGSCRDIETRLSQPMLTRTVEIE